MKTPLSGANKEWRKDHLTDADTKGQIAKNISEAQKIYDITQIFSIVMGLDNNSVPPELPQIEFSILQNWTQIAVQFTKQMGESVGNYSAVIAYNGILTESKRRELYQFLTKYFLDGREVFSLVIQQPQQTARG